MIITLSCLNSDVFALRARYPARGIRHFAVRGAAGVFAFHPANGGYRRSTEAARLKGLGMRPGVPDVVAPFTAAKSTPSSSRLRAATSAQLQAIEEIRAAGGHAQVCYGLDCALALLEGWGLSAAARHKVE
jgi:hypothetical protein